MSYQSISRESLYNTLELCVNLYHLNVINSYLPKLGSDYDSAISSPCTTPTTLFKSNKKGQEQIKNYNNDRLICLDEIQHLPKIFAILRSYDR